MGNLGMCRGKSSATVIEPEIQEATIKKATYLISIKVHKVKTRIA